MLKDLRWAIDGVLARSSRPGYPSHHVEREAVDSWLEDVRALGVRSILCLLSERQLGYYAALPDGLLETYRQQGFTVEHIPIEDPAHHRAGYDQIEENCLRICQTFDRLPRPVLIHCSAGLDRTGYAVRFIEVFLEEKAQAEKAPPETDEDIAHDDA